VPSKRPRILYMGVVDLAADQGDSIHVCEMIEALRHAGAEVIPLTLQGGSTRPTLADGHMVRTANRRFLRQLSWNTRGTLAAVRIIRNRSIDGIYSRLDPGMIANLLSARLTRKPLVVEMNGFPSSDIRLYGRSNLLLNTISRKWERLMYHGAARIVGARGYIEYVQSRFGVVDEKCIIAPLGVNTGLFFPRERHECQESLGYDNRTTVVWSGQITAAQGIGILVPTARLLKRQGRNYRWLVVGDGPLRVGLESVVAKEGLGEDVIFTGRVPYRDVPVYIGCGTVCVATFPATRGLRGGISALKTLTYVACGRPTITTDMDDMAQAIDASGAGIAVKPDDPEALAVAVIRIVESKVTEWSRMGRAALELAQTRTWEHKASLVLDQLEALW
jgi:glycosyltransferase involved in cell wall biosynthesis